MSQWSYNDDGQGYGLPGVTRVVKALLIANIAVFIAQSIAERMFGIELVYGLFALSAPMFIGHGFLWQIVTYMFLHGNLMHILMNMFMLFFLGPETERMLGPRRFAMLYFGCGIIAGLGWLLISGRHGHPCVGASGALFGVLGAFAAMFPERRITLLLFFVLPITMTARMMALGLGLIAFLSMMAADGAGGIAHAAHLFGGVCGYFYGLKAARDAFYGRDYARSDGGFSRWFADARANWRRRKLRVEQGPTEEDVNRVLDKMLVSGFESLSKGERDTLDKASRRDGEKKRL